MTLNNFEQFTTAQRESLNKHNGSFYMISTELVDDWINNGNIEKEQLMKIILSYIAYQADKVTGKWQIPYEDLAKKYKCDKSFIGKTIKASENGGLITKTFEDKQMFVTFTPFGRACFSMLFDLEEKMLFDSKEKTGKK